MDYDVRFIVRDGSIIWLPSRPVSAIVPAILSTFSEFFLYFCGHFRAPSFFSFLVLLYPSVLRCLYFLFITTLLPFFLSPCSPYLALFCTLLTFRIYLLLIFIFLHLFSFPSTHSILFLLSLSVVCLKLGSINTSCFQNRVYQERTTCNVRTSNPQSSPLRARDTRRSVIVTITIPSSLACEHRRFWAKMFIFSRILVTALQWKAVEFWHVLPRVLPKVLIFIFSEHNWRYPYYFSHILDFPRV
jgi:hypothetical protein